MMPKVLFTCLLALLLFSQCKNRDIGKSSVEDAYTLDINEVYIQREIPGMENGISHMYVNVYFQKTANVEIVELVIQDKTIVLQSNATSARAELKTAFSFKPGEKSLDGVLRYIIDGDKKEELPVTIEWKEPLYMP